MLCTFNVGATLWENPKYVSPAANRSAMKKMKAGKYVARVQAKAAHEANRPTEPTYKVDPTDVVFDTSKFGQGTNGGVETNARDGKKAKRKNKHKGGKSAGDELQVDNSFVGEQVTADSG